MLCIVVRVRFQKALASRQLIPSHNQTRHARPLREAPRVDHGQAYKREFALREALAVLSKQRDDATMRDMYIYQNDDVIKIRLEETRHFPIPSWHTQQKRVDYGETHGAATNDANLKWFIAVELSEVGGFQ